jgi:hypothetical protein
MTNPFPFIPLLLELYKNRSGILGAAGAAHPGLTGPAKILGGLLGAQPRVRTTIQGRVPTGRGIIEQKSPTSADPLSLLFQQLLSQLQQPVQMPSGIDTAGLMRQVKSVIDPIYNQRAQSATNRTNRGREEVKGMYRGLADDYERLAPEQAEQAKQAQEDIATLYGNLRSNIEGSYSRVAEEQADLFQQLGIEAALPDVLEEQQAATTDASNRASELQAINEQRYLDQGNIDETYYREGSPLATMTGVNVSKDMMSQLNDYLNQIEAERTSGIQSAYTDLYGKAQQQFMQQQQMAQQENSRKQEMLWGILQSQMSPQGTQQGKLDVNSFMSTLPSSLQQSVAQAFTKLQRSPEAVYGKTVDPRHPVPGTFVETTPEWFMSQADEMLRRGEIDPSTHQALLMYLQLHFGK